MAEDAQRLRIVDQEASAAGDSQLAVVRDRCRPAARRTESIANDHGPGSVACEPAFERGCVVMPERVHLDPPPARTLYAPAGNWVSPRIHIDRLLPRHEHSEKIPK